MSIFSFLSKGEVDDDSLELSEDDLSSRGLQAYKPMMSKVVDALSPCDHVESF
jgi:hypothetical protein